MTPIIYDRETGEFTVAPKEWDLFDLYWWTDGNGGCDCNREIICGNDEDNGPGLCDGSRRYYIVAMTGDLEGYTEDEVVREANQDYPNFCLVRVVPN
jgi:hypothetical protein